MLGESVGGFVRDAKVLILKFIFKRALVFVFCASLMLAVRRPLVMDRCLYRNNAGHILVHGLHHRVLVRQITFCCLKNRSATLRGGLWRLDSLLPRHQGRFKFLLLLSTGSHNLLPLHAVHLCVLLVYLYKLQILEWLGNALTLRLHQHGCCCTVATSSLTQIAFVLFVRTMGACSKFRWKIVDWKHRVVLRRRSYFWDLFRYMLGSGTFASGVSPSCCFWEVC